MKEQNPNMHFYRDLAVQNACGSPSSHVFLGSDAKEKEYITDYSNYGVLPMHGTSRFNMSPVLVTNILSSRYYKGLNAMNEVGKIIQEAEKNVHHVEPFVTTTGSKANTPSTCFCLLYKLCTIKLSKNQMKKILNHKITIIRCIGLLYLRFTLPMDQFWTWIKPHILDKQIFNPTRVKSHDMSLFDFINMLVSDTKFYGTILPRIPKPVELDLKLKLLKIKNKGAAALDEIELNDAAKLDHPKLETSGSSGFCVGEKVSARYSGDGKWYDAKVLKVLEGEVEVAYEGYDDSEITKIKFVKKVKQNDDDMALLEELKRVERERATTSGKTGFISMKPNVSMPMYSEVVSREMHSSTVAKSKSTDEILERQGRLGHVAVADPAEEERKARKRKERAKTLEKVYGNEAKAPKRTLTQY